MGNNDYLERCTSIAVFGGTFDPFHNGHLAIAESVLHQFKPERVMLVPTGTPPHKPSGAVASGEDRYQMVLRAVGDTPGLDATRMEIERTGTSYTIDTINAIRNACAPGCKIYFILGQDSLLQVESWKNAAELLTACEFITIPRPGYAPELLQTRVKELNEKYGAVIHILDSPLLYLSSSNIRQFLAEERPVNALMPQAAIEYARQRGLYGLVTPDLSDKHFEWAKARVEKRLTPRRFKHTLGVVMEAEKLARHYGANPNKARWAGLLHDCVKECGAEKKRFLCHEWNVQIDPLVESHIDLAHGLLGAESAQRHFFVKDEEILQAIRFHIAGHKDVTLLDKIICLADFIEPYREDYPPLQRMRELAYVNINEALHYGLTEARAIDGARGKELHHWSLDTIEVLEREM